MKKQIYLDYAATTPLDKRVVKAMCACLDIDGAFGNPTSSTHSYGLQAKQTVETARGEVAELIGAEAREIIFTSGATESDNLALKGVAFAYAEKGRHVITSAIEHKAVIDVCAFLETKGFRVSYLTPDKQGQITLAQIEKALCDDTILISIMAVNNELGTGYPLEEIGELARARKILFHVDAAQAVGKVPIDVKKMHIDLLSISGHKMYGPKGIGALYIRRKPKVKIAPLIHGGGHERGYRAGTLATHQIVGLGKACVLMSENRQKFYQHVLHLRTVFLRQISMLKAIIINTPLENSYPGIINITFEGVDGEALIGFLHEFALSMGSACNSASIEPSYVLRTIGLTQEQAHGSLRFSFGQYTTEEEVDFAAQKTVESVNKLRALSPKWERD